MVECRNCSEELDVETDQGDVKEDWLKVVCQGCGEITNVSLVRASQKTV
jgi:ribosomal protein S27E